MSSQPEQDQHTRRAPRRRMRRRTLAAPQTIESYIRANSAPRYMRLLRDLEVEYRAQRRRLEATYAELLEAVGEDAAEFARRWRRQARSWRFDRLNDLVGEHNAWYPMEANLPMDPRTGDYRPIRGASYRRVELGPAWVLEHFPPDPRRSRPSPPVRAPRAPLPLRRALRRV